MVLKCSHAVPAGHDFRRQHHTCISMCHTPLVHVLAFCLSLPLRAPLTTFQPPLSLQAKCLPPLPTDSPVSMAQVSPSSPRLAHCTDIATGSLTTRLASLPSTADAY